MLFFFRFSLKWRTSLKTIIKKYSISPQKYTNPKWRTENYKFYIHGLILVEERSSITSKNALYNFAKYFRREFGYDFVQYYPDEDNSKCIAYLFPEENSYHYGNLSIGAVCFRHRKNGWALQWVWLHPYFRNKGLFRKYYPEFKKVFGDFKIEGPYSKAMDHLIKIFNH